MAFKDILLHVETYPDAASPDAVEQGLAFCATLGRTVTAAAFRVKIALKPNRLADRLVGLSDLVATEEGRSLRNANELLARFTAHAGRLGVTGQALLLEADYLEQPERLAEVARTHDVCVLPYSNDPLAELAAAQAVIFGSARPAIVLRTGPSDHPPVGICRILIAWDGSRAAARAVADAMPLLKEAQDVCLLTVLGDKPQAGQGQADPLLRHLAVHGIEARKQECRLGKRTLREVFVEVGVYGGFDLLVMGAYGHSRFREFVLGGATLGILNDPPMPVLLSH